MPSHRDKSPPPGKRLIMYTAYSCSSGANLSSALGSAGGGGGDVG